MHPISYISAMDCARELLVGEDCPTDERVSHIRMAIAAAQVAADSPRWLQEWRILVEMDPTDGPYGRRWVDSGEGPWSTFTKAEMFAHDEVNVPWKLACVVPEFSEDK
ncbi:MAG: hypothetical protein ACC628_18200 [Pirellulaceae bacterium]